MPRDLAAAPGQRTFPSRLRPDLHHSGRLHWHWTPNSQVGPFIHHEPKIHRATGQPVEAVSTFRIATTLPRSCMAQQCQLNTTTRDLLLHSKQRSPPGSGQEQNPRRLSNSHDRTKTQIECLKIPIADPGSCIRNPGAQIGSESWAMGLFPSE